MNIRHPFLKPSLRLTGLITAAGAVASLCSLLGFLGMNHWFFDLCSHFRVQYLLGLGLAALLLLALRRRKEASVFGVMSALNLAVVVPLYGPVQEPGPPGPPIRAMLFNVNTLHGDPVQVRKAVAEADPDILVLEEVSRRWLSELAPVVSAYPYSREAPGEDNFGIALYSRLPFKQAEIRIIGEAEVPSIVAEIETCTGPFTLLATHPLPPGGPDYSRWRNEQLSALAREVQALPGPVLLMGDLNLTPWSPYFRRFLKESGLRDSAQGRGVQPTWPTSNPLLRIPLDHALHAPGIGIINRRVGPHAGSDHFPLIVDFSIGDP